MPGDGASPRHAGLGPRLRQGHDLYLFGPEFGLQVWAADLWIRPGDNWQRIKEAGLEECVFPIHAGPYKLPFAPEFFDAVVSLDSHRYYGTNDMFLKNHLVPLVKRGGQQLGIVVPGLTREFESEVPEAMQPWWDSD